MLACEARDFLGQMQGADEDLVRKSFSQGRPMRHMYAPRSEKQISCGIVCELPAVSLVGWVRALIS